MVICYEVSCYKLYIEKSTVPYIFLMTVLVSKKKVNFCKTLMQC